MSTHSKSALKVFVKPNAGKLSYKWLDENILKVELTAPPENNRANIQLIKYLSELLDISPNKIHIKGGHASKHKHLLIEMDWQEIKMKLRN